MAIQPQAATGPEQDAEIRRQVDEALGNEPESNKAALVNAIRRSLGRSLTELPFYLGGTLGQHPEGGTRPGRLHAQAVADRLAAEHGDLAD